MQTSSLEHIDHEHVLVTPTGQAEVVEDLEEVRDRIDQFVDPQGLGMLVALNAMNRHIYTGTVSAATKARRRAKNKAARLARRVGR